MNRTLLQTVVRHAEALAAAPSHAADAELLDRFAASKDDAAFAELVRRHGPMVWGVCRHTLPDAADADDAFQATFLALIRSAGSIRNGSAVGGWLHGVAVRVCTKVRRAEVRRRQREHKVASPEADRPVPDSTWDALLSAVHEEVRKLPDAERTAFVLCDLEGVRQPDAAGRLGWKLGTLSGRLTKARQRLLERLTSRGLAPALAAGGLGIGATANAAVPDSLVGKVAVLSRAGDAVSPVILKLVAGVMPMSRAKLLAAAVFVAGGLAVGFGSSLLGTADAQTKDVIDDVKKLLGGADGGGQPPAQAGPATGRPGGSAQGPPGGGTRPSSGGPASGPPGSGSASGPPGMSAGGAPGGMGMPGGMSMGMSTAAPARPQWDYLFADRPGTPDDFKKVLRNQGIEGWEFCGTGPGEMLVFKRPKTATTGGAAMGMGTSGTVTAGGRGSFGNIPMGGWSGGGGSSGAGEGGGRAGGAGSSGGDFGGGGGRGSGEGGGLVTDAIEFQLKHASANDVVDAIKRLLPDGAKTTVTAGARSNSVVVQADPKALITIRGLIESFEANPGATASFGTAVGAGSAMPKPTTPPPSGMGALVGGGGPAGGGVGALIGGGISPGGVRLSGPGGSPAKKMELTTLTLERADAQDALSLVIRMLDGRDAKFTVVPGSNAILLYADAETTEFARKVIEAIEKVTPAKKVGK